MFVYITYIAIYINIYSVYTCVYTMHIYILYIIMLTHCDL